MVEGKVISIGNVAYVLGMSSKKLQRWYQHVLSGFTQAFEAGDIGRDNLTVNHQGERVEIAVPIIEEKHLGDCMAIDEKTINGVCYTILSNRDTGKIALMAATLKTKQLMELVKRFDIEKRMRVKSLTRDMATNYQWLGVQAFMNAYHVIDKFHIIKHIMEQLQAMRIRYRQDELAKRRAATKNKTHYKETTFANGDSILQLLARSRGLLFTLPNTWTDQQNARAKQLFTLYPELKTAYKLILQIRKWFTPPTGKTTYQTTRAKKEKQILVIVSQLIQTGIEELKNIAYLLKKNLAQILHYFIAKETNAKAEALNQNLQRFINVNYGARNTDFFLYRVKIHFS